MKKGFTLLELIIVIIIIGILTTFGVPKMVGVVQRAKYMEAMAMVDSIARAQIIYFLINGHYTLDINDLTIDVPKSITEGGIYTTFWREKGTNDQPTQVGMGLVFPGNGGSIYNHHKLGLDVGINPQGNPDIFHYWWREDLPGKIGGGAEHCGGGFQDCSTCPRGSPGCSIYYDGNGWEGLH